MVAVEPRYCHQCGRELTTRGFDGRERAYCPDFERPFFRNAIPSIGVMVRDGDDLLVIRRAVPPDVGCWALPGGHPEYDEEPTDAAVRELREETGYRVDPGNLSLFTVIHSETDKVGPRTLHYFMITFVADGSDLEGELDPDHEVSDVAFRSIEDLLSSRDETRAVDRRRIRMLVEE